jgi:hypothetical protein
LLQVTLAYKHVPEDNYQDRYAEFLLEIILAFLMRKKGAKANLKISL